MDYCFRQTVYFLMLSVYALELSVVFSHPPAPSTAQKAPETLTSIETKLRSAKTHFEELSRHLKTWPKLTCLNLVFKRNDSDPSIVIIRSQLIAHGYIPPTTTHLQSQLFDKELQTALTHFQADHCLDIDGAYGFKTCTALNQSAKDKIDKIDLSLVRLKKIKQDTKGKSILVNVPTFELFAMNDETIEQRQKVVVGMPSRPTPYMTSPIVQIVLNPTWSVPPSILFKDKLKKIKQDDSYLEDHNYELIDQDGVIIDQSDVDWDTVSQNNFPYKLKQKAGDYNALGKLKFILVNDQAIYMHGTPSKKGFQKGFRSLSSGCIRIENPVLLAAWVLKGKSYTYAKLNELIEEEETKSILVRPSIPVHIVNLPAFLSYKDFLSYGNSPY